MELTTSYVTGPHGQWLVAADGDRLVYLGFPNEARVDLTKLLRLQKNDAVSARAVTGPLLTAVTALLNGDDQALPPSMMELNGTPFQQRVWAALRQISRGETRTYSELAAMIGQPTAIRAVAHAVATNPIPLAVPCHRVLPKSGGVGQYRGGSKLKAFLLSREGVNPVK